MNKLYYYADFNKNEIKKCVLHERSFPMIQFFKGDGELENFSQSFDKRSLFDNEKDAAERIRYLDKLYNKTFLHKPFLNEDKLVTNLNELVQIEKEINHRLDGYPNFAGIDFCDVSAGGIQIRGFHSHVKRYTYGSQITIKYDFSNYKECIDEFVDMWKSQDKPEKVSGYQSFIADGEKYGWD